MSTYLKKLSSAFFVRFGAALLVLVMLGLWFGSLEYRDLFNPDEGRYAEIPREMLESGDWVTPRLNGIKYLEKPVLQYWITAIAYRLFWEDEWTARLWPAVAGLLTVLLVYFAGKRFAGERGARVGALVLASTFQFFLFSQVLTLDMGLTFFLTLALVAFIAAQDVQLLPVYRERWMLLTWAAMALAVLSKGLIGVLLPALVLLAYVLVERDWRLLTRLHWKPGVLLFMAIVLPWFIAIQERNPEFFGFFFIHEHLARYANPSHARSGKWYYFAAVLLVGSLPWTLAYAKAVADGWRRAPVPRFEIRVERLLVLWLLVIVLFFSLSTSKLPGYILPVYSALALLVACRNEQADSIVDGKSLLLFSAWGLLIAAAVPLLQFVPKFAGSHEWLSPYVPWTIAGAGCLMLASLASWLLARRGHHRYVLPVAALGSLFASYLLVTGSQSVADQFSDEKLIGEAQRHVGEFDQRAPFYSVKTYDQTLPLHLGRTVTLVNYEDELAFGIAQEPQRAIATLAAFRTRWNAAQSAYAIMPLSTFAEEKRIGTPMILLAKNNRAVIVARNYQVSRDGANKPWTEDDRF